MKAPYPSLSKILLRLLVSCILAAAATGEAEVVAPLLDHATQTAPSQRTIQSQEVIDDKARRKLPPHLPHPTSGSEGSSSSGGSSGGSGSSSGGGSGSGGSGGGGGGGGGASGSGGGSNTASSLSTTISTSLGWTLTILEAIAVAAVGTAAAYLLVQKIGKRKRKIASKYPSTIELTHQYDFDRACSSSTYRSMSDEDSDDDCHSSYVDVGTDSHHISPLSYIAPIILPVASVDELKQEHEAKEDVDCQKKKDDELPKQRECKQEVPISELAMLEQVRRAEMRRVNEEEEARRRRETEEWDRTIAQIVEKVQHYWNEDDMRQHETEQVDLEHHSQEECSELEKKQPADLEQCQCKLEKQKGLERQQLVKHASGYVVGFLQEDGSVEELGRQPHEEDVEIDKQQPSALEQRQRQRKLVNQEGQNEGRQLAKHASGYVAGFPQEDRSVDGDERNIKRTPTDDSGHDVPPHITCSICYKEAFGAMKKCQCGNASCDLYAHLICVSKINPGQSLAHPCTPAPQLPTVLCSKGLASIFALRKHQAKDR